MKGLADSDIRHLKLNILLYLKRTWININQII